MWSPDLRLQRFVYGSEDVTRRLRPRSEDDFTRSAFPFDARQQLEGSSVSNITHRHGRVQAVRSTPGRLLSPDIREDLTCAHSLGGGGLRWHSPRSRSS